MRQVKMLLLVVMAGLALSSISATSALAAKPELLPEATAEKPITFVDSSGVVILRRLNGTGFDCETSTSTGSFTSLKLGTFKIVLEKCKDSGAKITCTGLNDKTSGNITIEGEVHLWYGLLKSTKTDLHTAFVLLPKHIHFSCGGIELILILGCVAGLVKEVNKFVKKLETVFESATNEKGEAIPGVNDITSVLNEKGEWVKCILTADTNEAAEEVQMALLSTDTFEKFEQNKKAIEVLILA